MSDGLGEALLSPEETEALLAAMRDGALPEGPEAKPTQLGAPDTPLRRALRAADEALPKIASSMRDELLRMTSTTIDVRERPCDIAPRDAAAGPLDGTSAIWALHRDDEELGLVSIGGSVGRFVLDRRLGTSDSFPSGRADLRPLSGLDRRMLEPLARMITDAVSGAMLGGVTLSLVAHRAFDPDDSRRFAPMLRMALRATLYAGQSDEITVALGAPAFVPRASSGEHAGRSDRVRVASRLGAVDVELIAILGRAPATVRALLSMESGTVLRLDGAPERPIGVCIDDVTVMRGMPCVQHGNLAIEITEHPKTGRKAESA